MAPNTEGRATERSDRGMSVDTAPVSEPLVVCALPSDVTPIIADSMVRDHHQSSRPIATTVMARWAPASSQSPRPTSSGNRYGAASGVHPSHLATTVRLSTNDVPADDAMSRLSGPTDDAISARKMAAKSRALRDRK